MSYVPPSQQAGRTRVRDLNVPREPRASQPSRARPESAGASAAPQGAPWSEADGVDWARVGIFAAGIALGTVLGAGSALLLAPQSGIETRRDLRRNARRLQLRAVDRWDELGSGFRKAARQRRRGLRRSIARSRWAAADFFDRG